MQFFASSRFKSKVSGQYIFLDNDFLSKISQDENFFKYILKILTNSTLLIDPLTEIEFLRDLFLPQLKKIKEEFISQPLFSPVAHHPQITKKIQENALLLSKIYSQKNKHKDVVL